MVIPMNLFLPFNNYAFIRQVEVFDKKTHSKNPMEGLREVRFDP